jgi:DNA-binding NarL/FixJ family response regulator
VCAEQVRPPRVLLGNLGVEVAEESRSTAVADVAAAMEPDAVVLPLEDDDGATGISRLVRAAAPAAKVILWARDESRMHVYDAGRTEPRRVADGTPDALLNELEHN